MKTKELLTAALVTLQFGTDPLVTETSVISGREVLATNPGPLGTLLFVVRRPGWQLCRGDARILQEKKDAGEFEGFRLCSVVKEAGVDDEGLNEFVTEYFNYDTYKDQALTFYHALGSGEYSTNPFAMFAIFRVLKKRSKEQPDVKGNLKGGEGNLQGGWILFDKEGIPKAAFQENVKIRVPIDDILKEVKLMRDGGK